jgi:tetratricopeptide (TPR) repeat protein
MMTGQSKLALAHIQTMASELSDDFLKEFGPMMEAALAFPLEVKIRFGRWDDVLATPAISTNYSFSHAFQSAARAIAWAAKGDAVATRQARAVFLKDIKLISANETAFGNNTCQSVVAVIILMVDGEILVREGHIDEGVNQLRQAVKAEDQLRYSEPPDWLIPVRHSLGATLMRLGRYAEAEQVYREDLVRLPNNGWSLFGLGEALARQHKDAEAKATQAQFRRIWKKADLVIHSSCLCQPESQ